MLLIFGTDILEFGSTGRELEWVTRRISFSKSRENYLKATTFGPILFLRSRKPSTQRSAFALLEDSSEDCHHPIT